MTRYRIRRASQHRYPKAFSDSLPLPASLLAAPSLQLRDASGPRRAAAQCSDRTALHRDAAVSAPEPRHAGAAGGRIVGSGLCRALQEADCEDTVHEPHSRIYNVNGTQGEPTCKMIRDEAEATAAARAAAAADLFSQSARSPDDEGQRGLARRLDVPRGGGRLS